MGKKTYKKRKFRCSSRASEGEDLDPPVSELIARAERVLQGEHVDENEEALDVSSLKVLLTLLQSKHEESNLKIHEKLEEITQKLCKLDEIERKLSNVECGLLSLGVRVEAVEKKNREIEKSVSFMSKQFDGESKKIDNLSTDIQARIKEQDKVIKEINKQLKEVKSSRNPDVEVNAALERSKAEVRRHETMIESMARGIDNLRRDRNDLQEKVTDLQCRSMKMNLVFNGLEKEHPREDTEGKLREFLSIELGINAHVEFANVHRFGRYNRGRPRPIVARFIYQHDLNMVLESAYLLRGTPYGIHQQFPAAVEERRRSLYPVMHHHRQQGANVKMVRDRLYINGEQYDSDDWDDRYPEDTRDETALKEHFGYR
ncbi:hypothetical protein FSP39_011605 [Pinctada imbricata]|uniref:Uncharacterized protein n=1 Tax=Pinctada imbricata TaxID=66713 RepID=A0AA88YCT9_PINIB|nr:hypothetical protein FSP39_011605 [Pinctada imbricata]